MGSKSSTLTIARPLSTLPMSGGRVWNATLVACGNSLLAGLSGTFTRVFKFTLYIRSDLKENRMTQRTVIHVVPNPKSGWDVKKEGSQRAVSHHNKKETAVTAGKRVAKTAALGQIKIHGQNGKIQAEYTYGNDPERSRG